MQEVLARAEVYMKGEKSNAEKHSRDALEAHSRRPTQNEAHHRRPSLEDFQRNAAQRRSHQSGQAPTPGYTHLNHKRVVILQEVMHAHLVPEMTPTRRTLGRDAQQWCEYHKSRGHGTEDCFTLKNEIEQLIRRGILKKFVKDETAPPADDTHNASTHKVLSTVEKASSALNDGKVPPVDHTLNTIAGGFAGGGATSGARIRYVHQVMQVAEAPFATNFPTMTFSPQHIEGVAPHEEDPL